MPRAPRPLSRINVDDEVEELVNLINHNSDRIESEKIANERASQLAAMKEMEDVYQKAQAAKRAGRWSQTGMLLAALGIVGDKDKQREIDWVARRGKPLPASDPTEIHRAESTTPIVKRGRGRPRKYPKLAPDQP